MFVGNMLLGCSACLTLLILSPFLDSIWTNDRHIDLIERCRNPTATADLSLTVIQSL